MVSLFLSKFFYELYRLSVQPYCKSSGMHSCAKKCYRYLITHQHWSPSPRRILTPSSPVVPGRRCIAQKRPMFSTYSPLPSPTAPLDVGSKVSHCSNDSFPTLTRCFSPHVSLISSVNTKSACLTLHCGSHSSKPGKRLLNSFQDLHSSAFKF